MALKSKCKWAIDFGDPYKMCSGLTNEAVALPVFNLETKVNISDHEKRNGRIESVL